MQLENGTPTNGNGGVPRAVRAERTNWRDQALSTRHRKWGFDCPATDLDFLVVEYASAKAVALVEYKHERSPTQYRAHPTYQAMIDLADRAGLPCLACRYAEDLSWWRAVALNEIAKRWVPNSPAEMTERDWVTLLYRMRGYEPPAGLFDDFDLVI